MPILKVRGVRGELVDAILGPHEEGDTKQAETTLNALSAVLSAVSVVVLLTQTRALRFIFQTWVSFIPAVRNPHSVQLVQNFTESLESTCDVEQLPLAMFNINITRNNVNSSYVMMPLAYDIEYVFPALLLIWVLAVSSAFQTYRCKHMPLLVPYGSDFQITVLLWGFHALLHAFVWIRLLVWLDAPKLDYSMRYGFLVALTLVCSAIIWWPPRYNNTSPDFGRWLEYTLTAPIQVIIVALSVWTRDRSTLYALGAAQASMMLCGVVVEEALQVIYEGNPPAEEEDSIEATMVKQAPPDKQRRRRAVRIAVATLAIAWISYSLIWYVLIAQFQRQVHITGKCDSCHHFNLTCDSSTPFLLQMLQKTVQSSAAFTNPNSTLNNASFVSNTELTAVLAMMNSTKVSTLLELATLFATPGVPSIDSVVQSMRADLKCDTCPLKSEQGVCEAREGLCQGQNDIPEAVLAIVATQCLLFAFFGVVQTVQVLLSGNVHGKQGAAEAWYTVALAYAVLSVTAKTALEVGFLFMLTQMPEELDAV